PPFRINNITLSTSELLVRVRRRSHPSRQKGSGILPRHGLESNLSGHRLAWKHTTRGTNLSGGERTRLNNLRETTMRRFYISSIKERSMPRSFQIVLQCAFA